MKIGATDIREGRAYIIGDVGSNFAGSLDLAKTYIRKAKEAGLDAIKFQTFRAEKLVNALKPGGEPWDALDFLKKYELPIEWHKELFVCAEETGIEFLTTPFDLDLLDELNRLGMRAFKVASGDLTFYPLLEKIASFGKPVILSTGMAYLHEVDGGVRLLKERGASEIALLHCVGNYPPSYESMNLRAMKTMSRYFGLPVGLSDHTPDDTVALAAIGLGCSVIEKHITLDHNLGTPDASFAMTVEEFGRMVERIRKAEASLGDGIKRPAEDEAQSRIWGRRGTYAREAIHAGEELTLEHVKFVRPSVGLEPCTWSLYEGGTITKGVWADEPLESAYVVPHRTTGTNGHRNSEAWRARADLVIPGASQTFSKAPFQYMQGIAPYAVDGGFGAYLVDVDGKRYLDYPMGLGAVILGYNYPEVNAAVERQLTKGASFSLPHPLEIVLAEKLTEIIPCAEMVRFGKNGSDATAGAVRLARAVTGRDRVACCGYHGWQDWYIGSTQMHRGVPDAVRSLTHTFTYNDETTLEALLSAHPGEFAAVIMEPAGQVPRDGFLERIRDLTHAHGALLIYDEIVSGFRLHLGGAQAIFNVLPDLACFGKAMANGFPISALVGKRVLMEELERVFFSFTFGGEAVSIAAALETIKVMEERDVLTHIKTYGLRLMQECRGLVERHGLSRYVSVTAHPQNMALSFKEVSDDVQVLKSIFQQEVLSRGILFNGNHASTFSHGPAEFDRTVEVYDEAFDILARAIESGHPETYLKAEPLHPLFTLRSNR